MVNQICRMEPARCKSASVTVDFALTSTQSALPPERSALEARFETASLRFARRSRGAVLLAEGECGSTQKDTNETKHKGSSQSGIKAGVASVRLRCIQYTSAIAQSSRRRSEACDR